MRGSRAFSATAGLQRNSRASAQQQGFSATAGLQRNSTDTILADIRLAMVPASMARRPEAGEIVAAVRDERANAADLHANGAEVRKAAQGEGGDREGAGAKACSFAGQAGCRLRTR